MISRHRRGREAEIKRDKTMAKLLPASIFRNKVCSKPHAPVPLFRVPVVILCGPIIPIFYAKMGLIFCYRDGIQYVQCNMDLL